MKVTCLLWRASSGGIEAQEILDEGPDVVLELEMDQFQTKNPLLAYLLADAASSIPSPSRPISMKLGKNESLVAVAEKSLPCMACGALFENRLKLIHHQDRICYKRNFFSGSASDAMPTGRGGRLRGRPGWLHDIITTPGAPRVLAAGTRGRRGRGSRGPRGGGETRGAAAAAKSAEADVGAPSADTQNTTTSGEGESKVEEDAEPKKKRGRPRIHPVKGRYLFSLRHDITYSVIDNIHCLRIEVRYKTKRVM